MQTRIARNEHGEIMDGGDTEPREFIDIWTFERDLTLSDFMWSDLIWSDLILTDQS